MVSRSRFFVASLWAALAPAGIFAAFASWIALFPHFHELGEMISMGGGVALLGVPFVYTGVVVATYGIGRGLYELHRLSRFTVIIVYGVLTIVCAWVMTWWTAAGETVDIARSFAMFLVLGLVAAGSTAFIWWRVVSRALPRAPEDEPRIRVRRRRRRSWYRRLASKW